MGFWGFGVSGEHDKHALVAWQPWELSFSYMESIINTILGTWKATGCSFFVSGKSEKYGYYGTGVKYAFGYLESMINTL